MRAELTQQSTWTQGDPVGLLSGLEAAKTLSVWYSPQACYPQGLWIGTALRVSPTHVLHSWAVVGKGKVEQRVVLGAALSLES